MRALVRILLAVSFALTAPGCSVFGVGCGSLSELQFYFPEECSQFAGDCCNLKDGRGFILCGSLSEAFQYPCGTVHGAACACAVKSAGEVEPEQQSRAFASFGVPPFSYAPDLPYAGMTSAHRLVFTTSIGDLQTFAGAVTYSPGFVFHGFTALGPAGTKIGSYTFDWGANGSINAALPLRALDGDTAYVDINLDGQATDVDPTIQHVANVPTPGAHTFQLSLPAGGDMAPLLARVFRLARIEAVLNAGILTNPSLQGTYTVSGTFTSIDPDTGDASDGTGQSPLSLNVPPSQIAITPSPLELLDHFLCYKTKPSKGLLCNATATVNAGGACATDAECGGVAGACAKNKWPKGVQLALADQHGELTPRTVAVAKPVRLCTPAEANAQPRNDSVTHLRGYQIKEAKGSPPRVLSAPLPVLNALGQFALQVKGPDSLLEPARKQLGSPAPVLGPNVVDRYQCYKPKVLAKRCAGDPTIACKTDAACGADGPCLGKFPKGVEITLTDQFSAGKRFSVVKPTRYCSPALANGDPIQSSDGHLMCFKVKPAVGFGKHTPVVGTIHTTSSLARERLDTVVEDEVCVPSLDLSGT